MATKSNFSPNREEVDELYRIKYNLRISNLRLSRDISCHNTTMCRLFNEYLCSEEIYIKAKNQIKEYEQNLSWKI